MAELPETPAAAPAPDPGLGQYQLVAELARGGMGIVYLAVLRGPAGFSKLFAIKVLKPELTEDETLLAMFLDEARLAARLEHANIARTVEAGVDAGRVFMVMEYLEGQTLHRLIGRLRARGALPLAAQVRVLANTLDGLHYAHELRDQRGEPLGIVHRDVTPHNVFITYSGHVKVMDFGIAKATGRTHETRTGVLKGKIAYMAPEQVNGDPVDQRADLFAVGVMLWEAITGRRLWHEKSDLEILHRLSNNDIPDPRVLAPDAPEALCRACLRALAPLPADRYATAADMRADLEVYLDATSQRITPAVLSTLVTTTFATERARVKDLVSEYLGRLRTTEIDSVGDDAPTLVMPPSFTAAARGMPVIDAPLTEHGDRLSTPALLLDAPPPRLTVKRLAFVAGPLVALALGLVIYRQTRHDAATMPEEREGLSEASASHPESASSASTAVPTTVELTVRAAPPSTTFTLDDTPLEGNPHSSAFPRDGAAHRLRATAEGYTSKTLDLVFDNNLLLDLVLERRRPTPHAPPQQRRTSVHGPRPSPEASGKAARRPIDTSTPYGGR